LREANRNDAINIAYDWRYGARIVKLQTRSHQTYVCLFFRGKHIKNKRKLNKGNLSRIIDRRL